MSAETAILKTTREADPERRSRPIVINHPTTGLWFAGWLFTLAIAELSFWKGVLALVIWPYYLGVLAR